MTKFRDILSISVASFAIIMMAGKNLMATDASEALQKPLQKKLTKKKGKQQKSKKNVSLNKKAGLLKQVNVSTPPKKDKTPLWFKISHEPIVHLKGIDKKIGENHPFNKALAAAYNYNSQIQSKLRQYYAKAEGVSQAMAGFRPSITGTAQTGYSVTEDQNKPQTSAGNENDARSLNPKSATLNVTQNIYKGGSTVAGMSAAENQLRSARADFLNTEQTILLNAANAYLELWFQREKLKTIQTSEKFYKESLDQVKAQAEVGESSTVTDVAQAEFSYEKSIAARIATEAELENAHATYVQIIGEEPPAVLTLPTPEGII